MEEMKRTSSRDIESLNRRSKLILDENKILLKGLNELNYQIHVKNTQIYNIETRIENLEIFEQHLTSLNLRCEFLDTQISSLENRQANYSLEQRLGHTHLLNGTSDFNLKIERRTTRTTLDNLYTEFSYLKEQLSMANEQLPLDSSLHDESLASQMSANGSASIFSEVDTSTTDEECHTSAHASSNAIPQEVINTEPANTSYAESARKKKILLKMESFLNFKDNNIPKPSTQNIGPLKGFRIHTMKENPLNDHVHKETDPVKSKASIRSIRKKLELVELPSIEEEYKELIENEKQVKENNYQGVFIGFNKDHRRHLSLPESVSIDDNRTINTEDHLRHFISDDTGLNCRFSTRNYGSTDLDISNLARENVLEKETFCQTKDNFISSSPFSSFEKNYIVDDIADAFSYYENEEQENTAFDDHTMFEPSNVRTAGESSPYVNESDESYGDENATPLLLRKGSKISLYRSKSHESIFSAVSKSTNNFPLREKNLDLKAQTMRWLKPNMPVVSSSVEPFTITSKISNKTSNAHDDMINILHSGVNKITELAAAVSKDPPQTPITTSWIPNKIFSSPIPISSPLPIKSNRSIKSFSNDGAKPSWISSFIPNSAFANPEIGRIISQSSAKQSNTFTNCTDNKKTLLQRERRLEHSSNGPSSSLTIQKNGNRIIKHGYGSNFNDNVLTSRVSHGALREALEYDMI